MEQGKYRAILACDKYELTYFIGMKTLISILFFSSSIAIFAQTECLPAFISQHFIQNNTSDSLYLFVNNLNQKSFPTEGPTPIVIPPGEEMEVSTLEWASEFKNPTIWYVFDMNDIDKNKSLNDPENWTFKLINKTTGNYYYTLEP
jgi:hypothetical protein